MRKTNKGFTLIELLAVIVILAVIAVIAVPLISKIIADSKLSALESETLNIVASINNSCLAKEALEDPCPSFIRDFSGMISENGVEITDNAISNGIVTSLTVRRGDLECEYNDGSVTCEGKLAAGLYDEDNNLIADWDTLVNTYNLDVTTGGNTGKLVNSALSGGTKLVIADGVTTIGNGAFAGSPTLTSVYFPASVTSIGESAFIANANLRTVKFSSGLVSIGPGAFNLCGNLTKIIIPNSVTTIGNQAFYSSGLTSINVPASVETMGAYVFQNCNSLTSAIVASTGSYMFSGCSHLTSIEFSDDLNEIADNLLVNASSLTSITIPASVQSIGEHLIASSGVASVTFESKNGWAVDSVAINASDLENPTLVASNMKTTWVGQWQRSS